MEPSHGDGSGEPFAPCADVLRPAGLRQTGDGTGFCQLSSGRFTDAQKWEHPDLHFTFPTIKTANMGSEHKPVSLDFIKEWRELLLSKGPYIQISDWMLKMGKTDADYNKQAIITAEETDAISHELMMMSSQGGYKISLIWLPERMNIQSANKILKLLEEPPRQTVFLLVSENPELLLETIRSRTQRIDFRKIETAEMEKR